MWVVFAVQQADPVLEDIKEVCLSLDQETQDKPMEKPTEVNKSQI